MMLLENVMKSLYDFTGRIMRRYIRNAALILAGVMMIAGISMVISEFDTSGQGRVYAVDSSEGGSEGQQQVQTGLKGVVTGVANMEKYSDATRLVSVADANENVLAGMRGIDRRAINRSSIGEGKSKARELGYYAQQTVTDNQMSETDYYTLLHIVEAEATGGDVFSKMMVAGVVLNRVRDAHFPDTIYEVVWQSGQFQPTSDGRIYSCTITDTTEEAVERVLQGEDFTQGALFFFARNSADHSNVTWFDASLVPLFEYGGHEYFTFKEYAETV